MIIFITKKGKTKFSPRVRISALRLHRPIRRINVIVADINKIYRNSLRSFLYIGAAGLVKRGYNE